MEKCCVYSRGYFQVNVSKIAQNHLNEYRFKKQQQQTNESITQALLLSYTCLCYGSTQ